MSEAARQVWARVSGAGPAESKPRRITLGTPSAAPGSDVCDSCFRSWRSAALWTSQSSLCVWRGWESCNTSSKVFSVKQTSDKHVFRGSVAGQDVVRGFLSASVGECVQRCKRQDREWNHGKHAVKPCSRGILHRVRISNTHCHHGCFLP